MKLKAILGRIIPFVLGVLIGAGLTRNKYFFGIIISYIIFIVLFNLLADKITKVKKSSDKKLAARNAAVEGVNTLIEKTGDGKTYGGSLFDKYYPGYIFYTNLILLIGSIYFLLKTEWLLGITLFIAMNIIIILNQVWRKVKYLDSAGYDKHVKDKIFAERLEKQKNKQLKKMGIE